MNFWTSVSRKSREQFLFCVLHDEHWLKICENDEDEENEKSDIQILEMFFGSKLEKNFMNKIENFCKVLEFWLEFADNNFWIQIALFSVWSVCATESRSRFSQSAESLEIFVFLILLKVSI